MNALPVKELTQPCAEHKEHVNGVGNEAAWAYGLHNQNAKLALRLACVSPRMIACNETAQGGRQCCPVNSILHLHAALKCLLPRGREQHLRSGDRLLGAGGGRDHLAVGLACHGGERGQDLGGLGGWWQHLLRTGCNVVQHNLQQAQPIPFQDSNPMMHTIRYYLSSALLVLG